jgi:predicted phage baseplate assembly protein
MTETCGCCVGPAATTPADTSNLPGNSALRRRVGTYGTFLETMQAELSSAALPGLAGLRTRSGADTAMALIDAWAVAGDVLTFYQERYANEGYLRTGTERRSVFELARLVDYAPRPGVSASVYLAYTLDPTAAPLTIPVGTKAQNVPDPGAQMQTFETAEPLDARAEWSGLTPRLGRAPMIGFPDALTRDRVHFSGTALDLKPGDRLLFLFTDPAEPKYAAQVLRRVGKATPLFDRSVTEVLLQPRPGLTLDGASKLAALHDQLIAALRASEITGNEAQRLLAGFADFALGAELEDLQTAANVAGHTTSLRMQAIAHDTKAVVDALLSPPREPTVAPPNTDPLSLIGVLDQAPVRIAPSAAALTRSLATAFADTADAAPQLLLRFRPRVADSYYKAWSNLPALTELAKVAPADPNQPSLTEGSYRDLRFDTAHVLRATASLFGYNAPKTIVDESGIHGNPPGIATLDTPTSISLEAVDENIVPGSFFLIEGALADSRRLLVARARTVASLARDDYAIQAKTTRIELDDPATRQALSWRSATADFGVIRTTLVYLRSEGLELADDPINKDVCGATIELPALLDGLQSGRRIIVVGERTDIIATDGSIVRGVEGREAAMLTGVTQGALLAGDRPHTILNLSAHLANTYRRESVHICANVVKATHGETHSEPLGSGNAAQPLQGFTLKQSPLTFVSAPTASGVQTTLEVRVNDVRWHETDTLADAASADRCYVVQIEEDATTTVTFGSGEHGTRLPTGTANIRALYRSGIGQPGNVKADSITLLASRPLGVREVTNPLRASGGADAEGRDQVRRNTPLAVASLDRLISLRDYADFARSFAGIGHAASVQVSDGARDIVHVTIAGLDDIPIDLDSDLLHNLSAALRKFGDPLTPIRVAPRELLALVLSANVVIDPDYLWDDVADQLRQALVDAFAFEQRDLARSAYLSEAFAAMHAVLGVTSIDIDVFDAVAENELTDRAKLRAKIAELVTASGAPAAGQPRAIVFASGARPVTNAQDRVTILPAQLAFIVPEVSETIVLNRR